MPELVLEQKAINDMGKRLEKLSNEDWDKLAEKDNSSLFIGNNIKKIGE